MDAIHFHSIRSNVAEGREGGRVGRERERERRPLLLSSSCPVERPIAISRKGVEKCFEGWLSFFSGLVLSGFILVTWQVDQEDVLPRLLHCRFGDCHRTLYLHQVKGTVFVTYWLSMTIPTVGNTWSAGRYSSTYNGTKTKGCRVDQYWMNQYIARYRNPLAIRLNRARTRRSRPSSARTSLSTRWPLVGDRLLILFLKIQ